MTDFTPILLGTSDVLFVILSWLDPTSRVCASLTCRAWRAAVRKQCAKCSNLRVALRARDFVMSPTLLDWGLNLFEFGPVSLTELAAKSGQLQTLRYLLRKGLLDTRHKLCWVAAKNGYVGILAWARKHRFPWFRWDGTADERGGGSICCASAAAKGQLDALKWLKRHGARWNWQTCAEAARGGHFEMLKWAHAHGAPMDAFTCDGAAKGGHLDILQWARTHGAAWTGTASNGTLHADTCAAAARGGYLKILQWARANGCPWDERACAYAVAGGQLETLRWLLANGCPWDEWSCYNAVKTGNLELLQWVRASGCLWSERVCSLAARHGHLEILQWARKNGCPWFRRSCIRRATDGGHIKIVDWIAAQP